jgi:Domain of unknown function (DUF4153)
MGRALANDSLTENTTLVMQQSSTSYRESLPVILAAAVVQGWALFGLHHAIKTHTWPATNLAWLFALYAVVVLMPLTVQLLAEPMRRPACWAILGLMTPAFFYFGWHHGGSVASYRDQQFAEAGECFPLAIVLGVLWLHLMPFVQARLKVGRWTAEYRQLFDHAWRNAITLAEAVAFTGLFWLLLYLWKSLFHMLQIDFFQDLFEEPIFVYPVTSLVFGCALHLIGSVDRLVSTVLDQILNVFKWLGTVTGGLLALFTLALLSRLPTLVMVGQKAIGASWLLWLVAVVVLFLNAAFRDGTVAKPYPTWIALCLRAVIPLSVVVSLTATYALFIRAAEYGLSVARVWGLIVAGAALIYSVGYSVAAVKKGAWFAAIARVNVVVAIALIVAISLSLTPILSPYRLSANSQYAMVLKGRFETSEKRYGQSSPFRYLRFDSGAYGRRRLDELAHLENHRDAERIRSLAAASIRVASPWESVPTETASDALAKMVIYPKGRTVDADLLQTITAELNDPKKQHLWTLTSDRQIAGLFVDLSRDGSGSEEFVLLWGGSGLVYQKGPGGWHEVGHAYEFESAASQKDILAKLARGEVSTKDPTWKELWIGTHRIRVQ